MQKLEENLENAKLESQTSLKKERDTNSAESDRVQALINSIQNDARTQKNNQDKTQSEVDVLTLRLNQQQEELNVSLEYQKNIRKEFAELSIKTDHQVEHITQTNNTKHDQLSQETILRI